MTDDGRRCPECGEPVGRKAAYCIHCSADLPGERDAGRSDDDEMRDVEGSSVDDAGGEADGTAGSRLWLVVACLGLAIAGIVLGTVVSVILLVGLLLFGVEPSSTGRLVVSLVGVQGIAFPGVSYAYFRYKGRSLREFIPVSVPDLREAAVILFAWIGSLLLVVVGVVIVLSLPGVDPAQNEGAQTVAENPEFVPFLIPLVFLLNAPGEELLFRGVIQGLFRERFGAVASILLATAMFAPIHIFALIGGLQAALVTITLLSIPSIVFGATYEYTDNFLVPTLVHGLYNTTLFVSIYVSETAGTETASLAGLLVFP